MAGEKPGFEWDVPEDRDVDAGDEARPHVEPPAPRPHRVARREFEECKFGVLVDVQGRV